MTLNKLRHLHPATALFSVSVCLISGCSRPVTSAHAEKPARIPPALVAVARAERQDLIRQEVLAAEFRPFQIVDVHAKVAGYLKKICVDVGDHVKEGQVLGSQKFAVAEKDLKKPTISALVAGGGLPVYEDTLRARYLAAGVNVNIPIFNGHLFTARRNEAELRSQAAEQNLHAVENRITRDVQIAFLNSQTAAQRLTVTAELLTQATQSLELAQARYDLGLSSIVELSQAQLNITSAQIANAGAKFDYGLQRAVLNYQSGAFR